MSFFLSQVGCICVPESCKCVEDCKSNCCPCVCSGCKGDACTCGDKCRCTKECCAGCRPSTCTTCGKYTVNSCAL